MLRSKKKRPFIILSVPFNEEKFVIIECRDVVIMAPNYIGRGSVICIVLPYWSQIIRLTLLLLILSLTLSA